MSSDAEPAPGHPARDDQRLHDDLMREYYRLSDIVFDFDQRLVTIKGWGVTLSLFSLGAGFQQEHYGLFLVAAASGLAFWVVEGVTKIHQMRFYPRMGDIEAAAYDLYRGQATDGPVSSPAINWSWYLSGARLFGGPVRGDARVPQRRPEQENRPRWHPLLFPHVALPHLISAALGTVLFVIGLCGGLGPI